jgi:hypothetical protein
MTCQFQECAGMAYWITFRLRRPEVIGSISSAICFLHPVSTSQIGTDHQVLEYLECISTQFHAHFIFQATHVQYILYLWEGKNYVHYNSWLSRRSMLEERGYMCMYTVVLDYLSR